LLVEDNPADVRLAKYALRASGSESVLTVVSNGEEAIAFLRRTGSYAEAVRPDLILLDLNMPRKDGREVLAEVKADPVLRRIPVVVFTTSRAESDIIRCYDLAANCYIVKPADVDLYLETLRAIEHFWLTTVTRGN